MDSNNVELTQELLKSIFDYKDGFLYWKKSGHGKKAGDRAGCVNRNRTTGDRNCVRIGNASYLNARLIFMWHYGYMPEFVDHIDRNGLNDKIENLRPSDRAQNNCNRRSSRNSTSKYLGVHKIGSKWKAQITVDKKVIYLGRFANEIDAAKAYDTAALEHHKEFSNLNFI